MSGKKVDMTGAPKSSALTAKGFPRNSRWFWKQMLKSNPEMFSGTNTQMIKAGQAPVVDPKWVEFNPSHKGYKGKLVHHHVDQGRFAVGIPDSAHKKYFSKLHSRYGAKAKGFFRNTMRYANTFMAALFVVDFFSSDPHSIGMRFERGIGVKNNKLYHDPESDNYYEVTNKTYTRDSNGNIESADVTIDVYSDYQYNDKTNRYEGAGEKKTVNSRVYYGEQARIQFMKLIKS